MGPAGAKSGGGGSNQRLARGSRHSPVASPEASGAPLVATAIGEWRTARHPPRPPPVGGTAPTATTSAWPLISPAAGPPQWRRAPLPAPLRGPAAALSDWSSRPSLNLDRWLGGRAARTCERPRPNQHAGGGGAPSRTAAARSAAPRAPPPMRRRRSWGARQRPRRGATAGRVPRAAAGVWRPCAAKAGRRDRPRAVPCRTLPWGDAARRGSGKF